MFWQLENMWIYHRNNYFLYFVDARCFFSINISLVLAAVMIYNCLLTTYWKISLATVRWYIVYKVFECLEEFLSIVDQHSARVQIDENCGSFLYNNAWNKLSAKETAQNNMKISSETNDRNDFSKRSWHTFSCEDSKWGI